MTAGMAGWVAAVLCALIALAIFLSLRRQMRAAALRAGEAERRLSVLSEIAPQLTEAATYSTPQTCERIVQRFETLLHAEIVLCFVAVDGRLCLGAKSDAGYAGFLKTGQSYDDGILAWSRENAAAALTGPEPTMIPTDLAIADLSQAADGLRPGPLAGSRDRVWALCLPFLTHRGYGLRPAITGALYAERKKENPFYGHDLRLAIMVARLAADALQRAQFSDAVRRESEIDPLTQLLTAAAFRKQLRQELQARRYAADGARGDVALFFIDTDNFKLWNDNFGHFVGDTLLKRLAKVFADVAHTGGFAGRNGGDEFCIALFNRTKDDAIAVAESLCATVERMDMLAADVAARPVPPVTISVGVAHFPVDVPLTAPSPADALLEAADARMYEAKRAGRNRVAYARVRALPTKLRYPGEGPIPRR